MPIREYFPAFFVTDDRNQFDFAIFDFVSNKMGLFWNNLKTLIEFYWWEEMKSYLKISILMLKQLIW